MSTPQILNARKSELLNQQEALLQKAVDAKRSLAADEETQFAAAEAEVKNIDQTLIRLKAIGEGKAAIAEPTSKIIVPGTKNDKRIFTNCSAEYADAFWAAFKSRNFTNAALGEGGTAADGSYLVPSQTDPRIPALAVIEASARKLSQVITTEMDIKIPYQASKTVAEAKAESNEGGTNAFSTNNPTFATTTLSAFQAGNSVYVSWELMQDVKALSAFLTADLNRAVYNYEEDKFINGSGTGEPQGYLSGVGTPRSDNLTINSVLDLTGDLKQAYYNNAKFLGNRQTLIALIKAQIAADQFQTFITYDANGQMRLLGYPVEFSSQMPVFVASPDADGALLFGDFASFATIGDRGDSNIRVKVLDQVAALNGQTVVLGYRRTDQRIVLQEAVKCLSIEG